MTTLLRPINEGMHRAEATITFSQFILSVGGCHRAALKASSARYYGLQIRFHPLPKSGAWKIKDITKAEVPTFPGGQTQAGILRFQRSRNANALGKVLQAAVDWHYLQGNPAGGTRLGDRSRFRNESTFCLNRFAVAHFSFGAMSVASAGCHTDRTSHPGTARASVITAGVSESQPGLRTAHAILGHSDLKTTLNVYTRAVAESQRRAIDKVADLLFPTVPEFAAATENGTVN